MDESSGSAGGASSNGGGSSIDAGSEWSSNPSPVTIAAASPSGSPTDGDGFLSKPAACGGKTVLDGDSCAGSGGIKLGPDWPCQNDVVYRAYLRFPLAQIVGTQPKKVTLRFSYVEHDQVSSPAVLFSIPDFGPLDASDWSIAPRAQLGQVLQVGTAYGPKETDVTAAVLGALAQDEAAAAFELRTESESTGGVGKWYCIANSKTANPPQLYVEY